MKIVITGATGHLGRYVTHRLASSGHQLVAVSRSGALPAPPFGEPPAPAGSVEPLAADIGDDGCVGRLAERLGPDAALVHLAAWHPPATAATTPDDRRRLIEINVMGTMRVLEAARRSRRGVSAVVYASTFEVYGDTEGDITEQSRVRPVSDYGATKLSGENHLISFSAEEGGVRHVALRMPAIYGPGEVTARALPNFVKAVARGEAPAVHGDGEDQRDELHARDAAGAVLAALTSKASGIFNISDGERHTIGELAREAMAAAGMTGEPRSLPRQKPRRDYHMLIDRARAELGYEPRTSLAEGVREQLAWVRAGQA